MRSTGSARQFTFDLARLRAGLKPSRLYWFPRLRSTNDHAVALRRRGALFAPAVVLTGHQIAGRGRGKNTWWSGNGSITVTFAFPIDEGLQPHELPLIAGLAVRDATAELSNNPAIELKWPNDLLFQGRKLAGLLCERVNKVDLIGIGINVNVGPVDPPRGLRAAVTSLSQISGRNFDATDSLIAIATHLRRMILRRQELPFTAFRRDYERHHALAGKQITVLINGETAPLSGRCEGIDDQGRLIVRARNQVHRIVAGHVLL